MIGGTLKSRHKRTMFCKRVLPGAGGSTSTKVHRIDTPVTGYLHALEVSPPSTLICRVNVGTHIAFEDENGSPARLLGTIRNWGYVVTTGVGIQIHTLEDSQELAVTMTVEMPPEH